MVRMPLKTIAWRRSIPGAWKQVRLLQPGKIAGAIAIAALNILWRGHGVLRPLPTPERFAAVAAVCYVITTVAEFLWLMGTGPRFTGFEPPTQPATGECEPELPALDEGVLAGAKPITEAANYLAALARRLK